MEVDPPDPLKDLQQGVNESRMTPVLAHWHQDGKVQKRRQEGQLAGWPVCRQACPGWDVLGCTGSFGHPSAEPCPRVDGITQETVMGQRKISEKAAQAGVLGHPSVQAG